MAERCLRPRGRILLGALLSTSLSTAAASEQGRTVSRWIPVPTDVSPAAQAVLGGPLSPVADIVPKTTEAWKEIIGQINASTAESIVAPTRALYPVRIEPRTIGGVPAFEVTPAGPIAGENRDRVLINLHGGAYIVNGGGNAVLEAIPVAHLLRIRVIAVDYRMPPDHPFPAALEDAVAVYRAVVERHDPRHIGVYGTSAGGGLTAALLLRLRELSLPLPGAVGLIAPWSDLSETGDSLFTNAEIDPTLVTYDGILGAAARLYAGDHDLKEPLVSPVYGSYAADMPPAFLLSSTRDLLLSGVVRLHRKLVAADVETELHVFEALWHDFPVNPALPEARDAWDLLARFFDRRLAR
jgi:Esterase/lipase